MSKCVQLYKDLQICEVIARLWEVFFPDYNCVSKKVPTFKLSVTLSNLNRFLNIFVARELMQFATQMFNISYHTLPMWLHCLEEFKSSNLLQIRKHTKKCIDFYMHIFNVTHLLITSVSGFY